MKSPAAPSAEKSSCSLHLHALHCTLGKRVILQGFTAAPLPGGQVVAVTGRNGAGKSTLLRCIAGLLPCHAERLQLGDTDLRPLKAAARASAVRYLPQAAPGLLHLTVYDCLMVALHAQTSRPATAAYARVTRIATTLGLTDLMTRPVDELSGGQKQLVWLAQALVHQPRALLLDEPLAALDPNHQHHVMRLLRRLASDQGLLVLIVLHDLNMAARYADQILVLHAGQAVAQGPAARALTPEVLAQAFQIGARIEHCSMGTPVVIIDDLLTV